jgi:hypothetical protein
MTEPAKDPPQPADPPAHTVWIRLRGRPRLLVAGGAVLVAVIVVGAIILGRGGDSPSTTGSPPLPATYRPGLGVGPVALGETPHTVVHAVGTSAKQPVPGTLVFARPGGQLAVSFARGRAVTILATGTGNPFGQRLQAEETTLTSWNVELCEKPAHVLLVAPGGHTYFVFRSAVAPLGAVGVSTSPVTACGPLG